MQQQVTISALSGGIAGIFVDLIYFPIETIKTRIQASSSKIDYQKTAQLSSKYKGLISQISFSFPAAFLFFYTYDTVKKCMQISDTDKSVQHIIAAAIGEFVANTCRNPFEVVKNQMQVGLNSSIRETVKNIVQHQGLKGFYSGYGSILLREIPFSSIQFPIYEKMKGKSREINNGQLYWYNNVINGATAGGIAAFFTTPSDVVKSKLMTSRGQFYDGFNHCIQTVWKEEGLIGFFRACHIRTLQISTSGVLFFGAYEKALLFLSYNN